MVIGVVALVVARAATFTRARGRRTRPNSQAQTYALTTKEHGTARRIGTNPERRFWKNEIGQTLLQDSVR